MCHGNGTIQCALGMELDNSHGNGTSQCSLGMGLSNVPWEWDYPMCTGNGTIQCALGMGLANVPWEWDYPMYSRRYKKVPVPFPCNGRATFER